MADTDLRDADLRRADLSYANLRDADLRETKHLNRANLIGAKVDDQTKWPNTFDAQAAGVVST
jgi:uncharacterized protein YjbI with pentapeptide repeats